MKILCVGGGPGGLFFAIAAARSNPDHEITVVERRPPDATFGWGIAVATSPAHHDDLLYRVHEVDPLTAVALQDSCIEWTGQRVFVGDGRPIHLGGSGYSMGRQRLIDVLVERARELGVQISFDTEVVDGKGTAGSDLVVVADGARSPTRRARASDFGALETVGRNLHLWLGTSKIFADFTYAFEQTSAGWIWCYGYRHDAAASTVIVECSAGTWAASGFGSAPPDVVAARLSGIFERVLDGHPLMSRPEFGSGSSWQSFTTVTNTRWHDDGVVLLGDAAHTAHFSIGSGTTMALEDAAVLGRAIASATPETLPAALEAYEEVRRPRVRALQEAAARSSTWFEDVDRHIQLAPRDFGFALRMRRNPAQLTGSLKLTTLRGLHLVTQWRLGRTVRRAAAGWRRSSQRRRHPSRLLRAPPAARSAVVLEERRTGGRQRVTDGA